MQTVTIKINNVHALKLIEDLEAMNLIEVIKNTITPDKKKLSERLAGSITSEQSAQMHDELKNMRNEWNRDI